MSHSEEELRSALACICFCKPHREQLDDAITELIQRRQQLAEVEAEAGRICRKLEALTPMGSEFCNRPDRCIQWIEKEMSERLRIAIKASGERQKAEAKLAEVQAEGQVMREALKETKEGKWTMKVAEKALSLPYATAYAERVQALEAVAKAAAEVRLHDWYRTSIRLKDALAKLKEVEIG